ncbi:MAG: FlgD immunoglobulin-like domain containing protein [bacterium]|nr:FlgD immunoglobulin-like domain containing protein [bacterium]
MVLESEGNVVIGTTTGLKAAISRDTDGVERLKDVFVSSLGTNAYGPSFFIEGADTTQDLVWDGQPPVITKGAWNEVEDSPYLWIHPDDGHLYFSSLMAVKVEVELSGTATDQKGGGLKEMCFDPVTSLAGCPTACDTTPAEWSGIYLIDKDSYADVSHRLARVVLKDRLGNNTSQEYYYEEDNEGPVVTIESVEDTAGYAIQSFDGSQSLEATSATVWATVQELTTRVAKVTLTYFTASHPEPESIPMTESDTPSRYFGLIPGSAMASDKDTISFRITAEDKVKNESSADGKYRVPWELEVAASYFKDPECTIPLPYNLDNLPTTKAQPVYIKVTANADLKEVSLSIDAPGKGNDIPALSASKFNGSETTWVAEFTVSPDEDGEANILVTAQTKSEITKPDKVPYRGDKFLIDTISPIVAITSIDKIVEPDLVYVFIKDTSTVYFKNGVEGLKATVALKVSASDTLSGFEGEIQGSPLFADMPLCPVTRGAKAAECSLKYEINQAEAGGEIVVTVSDIAGNTGSSEALSCLLDNDPPPQITGFTANDGAAWSDTAGITLKWNPITDTGSGLDHYEVKYEGEIDWQTRQSGDICWGKEDDAAAFYIRGVDRVGNTRFQEKADSTVIGIDLTPPRLCITKINGIEYTEELWLNADAGSFAGDCSDATGPLQGSGIAPSSFEYGLDGEWRPFNGQPGRDTWADTDEIPTITQQDSGQTGKPLMIRARDRVGHTTVSDTVWVRVDTTLPEIFLQWVKDEYGNQLGREKLEEGGNILPESAYTVAVSVKDAPIAPEMVKICYTTHDINPLNTTSYLVLRKDLTPLGSGEYRGEIKGGIKTGDTVSFAFIAKDMANNSAEAGPFSFKVSEGLPPITVTYLLDPQNTGSKLPESISGNPVTMSQKIYIRAVSAGELKRLSLFSITLDGDTIAAAVSLTDEGNSLSFISGPITIPEGCKNGEAKVLVNIPDYLGKSFPPFSPKGGILEIDTVEPTVKIDAIDTKGYNTLYPPDPERLYFRNDDKATPAFFRLLISAGDERSGLDKATGSLLFVASPVDSTENDGGKPEYEYELEYTVNETDSGGTITVKVYDLAGNAAADTLVAILDNDPPPKVPGFTIDDGGERTDTNVVTLKWKDVNDTGSGLDFYEIKYDNKASAKFKSGDKYQVEEKDHEAVFYVWGVDRLGNRLPEAEAASNSITIDLTGPKITKAVYTDGDGNGIDQGDTIVVEFNEDIDSTSVTVGDFLLPVEGNSFGNGAKIISKEAGRIIIEIGSDPRLRIAGEYSSDTVSAGSPSGIYTSTIKDLAGNEAEMTEADARDIGLSDTTSPVLIDALYVDKDEDGEVNKDDEIELTFKEPVRMGKLELPADADHFYLHVDEDSLGEGAVVKEDLAADTKLIITLGENPRLKIEGSFNPEHHSAGDPSGIDISAELPKGDITDISGNDAGPIDIGKLSGIDISGPDEVPPTIVNVMPRNGEEVDPQPVVSAWFSDTGSANNSGVNTETVQVFIAKNDETPKVLVIGGGLASPQFEIEGDWIKFRARLADSLESGEYNLSFKVKDNRGNLGKSAEEKFVVPKTIKEVIDFASYPNPAVSNPANPKPIYLRYVLGKDCDSVVINIYDYAGELIWTKDLGSVPAGVYKEDGWKGLSLDGEGLANGTYFCELVVDGEPKAYWRIVIFNE